MVLEGGAMRGMYTAAVLDVMMENNIELDGVVGFSRSHSMQLQIKTNRELFVII